jgi:hypothetical protein
MDEGSGPLQTVQKGWARFQDSRGQGYGMKQALADVIAGEYDLGEVQTRVQVSGTPAPVHLCACPARVFLERCLWA